MPLPVDLANFGKCPLATMGFASNVCFWTRANYFARAAEFNTLVHTRSLAVEEQLYIGLPVCLYVTAIMCRSRMAKVMAVTAAVSLGTSIWLSHSHPSVAFYWPVTRAWELLLGALIAVGPVKQLRRSWLRDLLSVIGLAMLLVAIIVISPTWPFPGWIALLPCLGAALIIYAPLWGWDSQFTAIS